MMRAFFENDWEKLVSVMYPWIEEILNLYGHKYSMIINYKQIIFRKLDFSLRLDYNRHKIHNYVNSYNSYWKSYRNWQWI